MITRLALAGAGVITGLTVGAEVNGGLDLLDRIIDYTTIIFMLVIAYGAGKVYQRVDSIDRRLQTLEERCPYCGPRSPDRPEAN